MSGEHTPHYLREEINETHSHAELWFSTAREGEDPGARQPKGNWNVPPEL